MVSPRTLLSRMSTMPSAAPRVLTSLTSSFLRPRLPTSSLSSSITAAAPFSSTAAPMARKKRVQIDSRIRMIRYFLWHPKTPRPLRFSRMRALRHWTIHRAWLLFQRKQREEKEGELMRMFNSMYHACEVLRPIQQPGEEKPGRLYRIAMEKKGVYGPGGIPIEYARAQTETPAREGWNHGWKR